MSVKRFSDESSNQIKDDLKFIKELMSYVNSRFTGVEGQLNSIQTDIREIRREVRKDICEVQSSNASHFKWIVGLITGLFVTITTALLKGHVS